MIGMAILNIAHGAYTRVLLMFSVVLMYMAQVFHGTSGDTGISTSLPIAVIARSSANSTA